MSEQNKIIGLSFTLVAVFVISFFNLYQSAKIEQDILNLTSNIHNLRMQNILINEQVSNDFKRQNYDKLNQLVQKFSSNWNNLSNEIKIKFTNKKNIISYMSNLDTSIKKEKKFFMRYESDKAVLVNSVFFLVKLESDIRHNSDILLLEYSDLLNTFLRNIIYYNVGLNEIDENIKQIISFMDNKKISKHINTKIVKKHLNIFYDKSSSIVNTMASIEQIDVSEKLTHLEKLFLEVVDRERSIRKFINILIALFSFLMLIGFLIVFFNTYRDKNKILQLQKDNEQKNNEIIEHMQLLSEHKRALDESSIVSKTDLHGIITYVNDNFCKISGYSDSELMGKPHNIVRHIDMPPKTFQKLWDTIKNKNVFHAIIKNRKKNGDSYYVDSTIIPILDIDGNITEYFAVRYDVTELVKAKEEALAAERAKSAFLATMSHELRTPLNAVIGFSQILLAKKDIPNETLLTFVDKINISGKHLLNLVNNILDFSKIESGKMELNTTKIILNNLIKDSILLVENEVKKKTINITYYGFNKVEILADEQLIKQVILNILSNAIKFSPNESKITISYKSDDKTHVISICDEGAGLTQEQTKSIFEPFSQIKEHQNEAIKGTGLGLVISKKIMELHNGKIDVISELGKGSCFNINLPILKD